jgi:anti-sigma factor RsiW
MGCNPLTVTAFVDGELSSSLSAEVERHLVGCPVCAGQAEFEIEVAQRLRSLPSPGVPPGLAEHVLVLSAEIARATVS